MSKYIYQQANWPQFYWDNEVIAAPLAAVRHRQGLLLGHMESLGLLQRNEAILQTLSLDVIKSSEIEGELLDAAKVRSSIARRLGMDIAGLVPADRRVDGVVEMSLEATQNFAAPLTTERLFNWHSLLFPAGTSGTDKLKIGTWRDDSKGPMQVVSGAIGREHVHYEAPPAERVPAEMTSFLEWTNQTGGIDPVLRAAVAHLWFVTIHPFDDGNGRIARAIADWALARSENTSRRFYSMSAQIRKERKLYYDLLEKTQKGSLDITDWAQWFLACLDRAIEGTEISLSDVFRKERFWKTYSAISFNERQRLMLNMQLDGFKGKLTSTKWAMLAKCSQDTAQRDIHALINNGVMLKDPGGGRSTRYSLKELK
ncbi:MAG: Fic family protein [Elusimicrobiota bacterium]|nr:Fic family protein [Elusimicrobiota bacterium]